MLSSEPHLHVRDNRQGAVSPRQPPPSPPEEEHKAAVLGAVPASARIPIPCFAVCCTCICTSSCRAASDRVGTASRLPLRGARCRPDARPAGHASLLKVRPNPPGAVDLYPHHPPPSPSPSTLYPCLLTPTLRPRPQPSTSTLALTPSSSCSTCRRTARCRPPCTPPQTPRACGSRVYVCVTQQGRGKWQAAIRQWHHSCRGRAGLTAAPPCPAHPSGRPRWQCDR